MKNWIRFKIFSCIIIIAFIGSSWIIEIVNHKWFDSLIDFALVVFIIQYLSENIKQYKKMEADK